ncbi:peptide-methionine (S)-S-oxide reductase MsrA [Alphaproteobacteria bacterium]|mgnify:FL=1|jgi:peptide-methionine (S)-S-oxide reductase|nr:peptide-methionine (S)-S-oxide reductase MsrA [Alphaproteobacteria bacterium]MDB2478532.1 peptide-methionine (S)-S-oxide reductase MsrA [Alphaproteobacteria bacterium]MDC6453198.1 peptide-methionine (S)-S-oxide reductase MsrA [Alphaproteobacteria bacterium]
MFFFNNKEEIVKKSKALVGRENQINIDLRNEINGIDFREIPENFKTIIIGMGCFWGAERIFWQLEGVYHTSVGYAGGHTKNPTYEEVCSGLTGHTEVVRVVYNPKKISLRKILIAFWEGHDPTQGMRQGNDIGTQYRSAIYIEENQDIKEVKKTMLEFQNLLDLNGFKKITTEIKYDVEFYFAEAYHQQYLYKNPNGYCGLGGGGVRFK